ncbi:zinc finger MYM-type protein 1-like [Neodiprion lecontei]|uniref:Zinc finger MYM-type protein 1-like n=1 Tax=Neodiprion lecontei TaxID=441921 RepID=A0ABM3GBK2_NEOLC|nr:zinc finger MYM-type protein 1-like [Neodiprion lecontei]
MGRCCAVHGCLVSERQDVELRSKWSSALGQELKASSFICELHFNPENVIKTDREILKDGSVYVYEYQKVHLRKKAEPKSHTNDDSENNRSLLLNNDSSTISDINDDTTIGDCSFNSVETVTVNETIEAENVNSANTNSPDGETIEPEVINAANTNSPEDTNTVIADDNSPVINEPGDFSFHSIERILEAQPLRDSTVNRDVDNIQDNPEGPEAEVSSGDTTQFSITESQTQKEAELSEELSGLKNDKGLWPVNITKEMIDYWAKKGSTELQNCDQVSLQNSVPQDQPRDTSNFVRKSTKNMFTRRNKNQETVNRFWLCFSPTTGKIYCYACKLMSTQNTKLSGEGFSDCKHASDRLCEHEISKTHLESVMSLLQRRRVTGRIDQELAMQEAQQIEYWRKNLKIIVSTIKFIAERGLAFRGDNQIVGSPRNGNFLGILELLAEYEPILATHLKTHANKGSGHVNYLSSTICEELISCMGDKVLTEIVSRIKKSKYYSVSVDSTPDESHIDQLTIVVRYMEGSMPEERFLTFLPNCDHSGKATANALLTFLGDHQIDIMDCRGQSYDNAANMSGKYKGMQALILEKNHLSAFVPCCGHSLNLVGKAAANSCPSAVQFFDFVQNLYTFFTASTERYGILIEKLSKKKSGQFYVLKKLSDTRWSCRAEATKAIVDGYSEIEEAVTSISSDKEQKEITRNEAAHLLQKMSSLETALFAIFWNDILERFNATNKMLQDPQMILELAMRALESLKSFVESKMNDFDK